MVGVKTNLLGVVANASDGVADGALDVKLGVCSHLADYHAKALGDGGLAGDSCVGVLSQHPVEDSVRDLVADLVRMTLCHRFRGHEKRRRGTEGSCHNGCQS